MKNRAYIFTLVMAAFILQVTSCTATNALTPIIKFVDREDVKDWDDKTLEEKRGIFLRARAESPDMFIEYIDSEIEKIDEKIRIRDLPPEPTPIPIPPPVDDDECTDLPPGAPAARRSMLWKPVSEKDGRLVVVFSKPYSGHILKAELSTHEFGIPHGLGNGCREHFRWSEPGASYSNSTLRAYLDNSQIHEWEIGDGSQRAEF